MVSSTSCFHVCLLILILVSTSAKYVDKKSKLNGAIFKYRDGIEGEMGLEDCEYNEVCNVVHDRFWMSPLVERLCRCPNGRECPWTLNDTTANLSMKLNNRSFLKFCEPIANRRICKPKQPAIMITRHVSKNNSYMTPFKVLINCECPQSHYWRLQKFAYDDDENLHQVFRCVKQKMCESDDFCGYSRSDLFSTYYRCTCPIGDLCVFRDKTTVNVQELLYTGSAYTAYCFRFES